MHTPITIGSLMRAMRSSTGMLQKDVASRIGVDQATVSAWEKNRNAPPLDKFLAFCETIGVDPSKAVAVLAGRRRYWLPTSADPPSAHHRNLEG